MHEICLPCIKNTKVLCSYASATATDTQLETGYLSCCDACSVLISLLISLSGACRKRSFQHHSTDVGRGKVGTYQGPYVAQIEKPHKLRNLATMLPMMRCDQCMHSVLYLQQYLVATRVVWRDVLLSVCKTLQLKGVL
jgi:hypothetical protein